jgi:hypothetical protein
MNENYDKSSFLAYIHQPMSPEAIQMIYTRNNIIFQKCELFNDFVKSLLLTVFETYMGDDVTNPNEQINHFNWCWVKTLESFKGEGFLFNNLNLYNYFLEFSFEVFYTNKDKDKKEFNLGVLKIWEDLFNYNKTKTNSDVDALIEIYLLMDNTLKMNKK